MVQSVNSSGLENAFLRSPTIGSVTDQMYNSSCLHGGQHFLKYFQTTTELADTRAIKFWKTSNYVLKDFPSILLSFYRITLQSKALPRNLLVPSPSRGSHQHPDMNVLPALFLHFCAGFP